ncbi:MAG TPA: PAS domain-containing protein [Rhizomicrobium sp.]|nr:PAS domain-containing protein [Rhizomicrobium sp.]
MAAPPKEAPPEIASAAAFNEAAARAGWPILCDDTCDFTHPMLGGLLELWREEAEQGIPERQEMTARKLQPFMSNVAIYERLSERTQRRYRVRLMGSNIVQHYGELTGKYIDEVVPEKYLARWYALSDVAICGRKPVRVLLRADTFDKSHIVAEYLCAPLLADGGGAKFVLLGMVFDGRRPWSVVEDEARRKLGLLVAPGS